jgi:hypothetical protein
VPEPRVRTFRKRQSEIEIYPSPGAKASEISDYNYGRISDGT